MAKSNLGSILVESLQAEGVADREKDQERAGERADYQRVYWQDWKKRKKRIFGTVSLADFHALELRAKSQGRTPWRQIWAESQAFLKGEPLPSAQIEAQQVDLIQELRRIGNALTQLARDGHIETRQHSGLVARGDDPIGVAALDAFHELERLVVQFDHELKLMDARDD